MTTREHEQSLNVRLSDELRARGLDAKPEVSHPGNRRDNFVKFDAPGNF